LYRLRPIGSAAILLPQLPWRHNINCKVCSECVPFVAFVLDALVIIFAAVSKINSGDSIIAGLYAGDMEYTGFD
jgi:hypothetical protein